jgi:hypothetical protein
VRRRAIAHAGCVFAALATLATASALATPHAALAQGVTGVVRHAQTSEPLSGVLVSVLDREGNRLRGTLSDPTGRYVVEVPMGRYRLRAERIGLRTEVTDTFDIRNLGFVFQPIGMVERAVLIDGLVVDSRVQSCRIDRARAVRIQHWWQEIRTALDVSAALQNERFATFELERFEREWDEDVRRIVATRASSEVSTSSRPFVSESADHLDRLGFVQGAAAGQRHYYAPDAEVLLSDVFLKGHCFSLEEDEDRPHQLGLRFQPVRGREVADIDGALWVDTTTAELQGLEFRYVNVEGLGRSRAGGAVSFDYLPNGAWIVSDWYIRMPKMRARSSLRGRMTLDVTGYVDAGGRVRPLVLTPRSTTSGVGSLRGIVYDSTRAVGLPDATVVVLGTARTATTDAAGVFELDSVPAGPQALTFEHAETTAWGLGSTLARVEVAAEREVSARLAVPSFAQAALGLCLGEGVGAETVLTGHLFGADRAPLPGVELELTWSAREDEDEDDESRRATRTLPTQTESDGRYTACTIPADVDVTLRARVGGAWIDVYEVELPAGRITYREVWFQGR